MKVSLIQSSIEWLEADRNRTAAEMWVAKCVGSHLVVLPEMFTTGFCLDPQQSAERCERCERDDVGGETLSWMQQMAAKYEVSVAGSVAIEEAGSYYNRLYVVKPNGESVKYDKRHLFSFAGEDEHYEAGEERVVVDIEGVRILLLICYDLRFPVWIRNRGRGDYDMILCVANWPTPRRTVWDLLLRARAIENVAYVCGVNIVGEDSTSLYSGGTAAIDFRGNVVASVADDEQGVATLEVDMSALHAFREKFPALDDADGFEIKDLDGFEIKEADESDIKDTDRFDIKN